MGRVSETFVLTDVSKIDVKQKIVANEDGGKKYIQRAEDEAFMLEAIRERGGFFENQKAVRQSEFGRWSEMMAWMKILAENMWYKENTALPKIIEIKTNESGYESEKESMKQAGILVADWNVPKMKASRVKRVDDFEKIYEDISKMNYPVASFDRNLPIIKVKGTYQEDVMKWKDPGTSKKGGRYYVRRQGSSEWSVDKSLNRIQYDNGEPISGQDGDDGEEWEVHTLGSLLDVAMSFDVKINEDKEDEQTFARRERIFEEEWEIDTSVIKNPIDRTIRIGNPIGAYIWFMGDTTQSEGSEWQQKSAMAKCRLEGKKVKVGATEVDEFLQWAGWSRTAKSLRINVHTTPLIILTPEYRAAIFSS